jgi:hypothetical protein
LPLKNLEDKYGFIDTLGNWIIAPQFDDASAFSEGFASVCKNDSCFYINKEGRKIFNYFFEETVSYKNGVAIVKNICMFKYYLEIFEKNDVFGKDLDDKIKDTNNTIANLIKNGAENRKGNDNTDYNSLIREKENLKNYHISNKKIYKELCDYIQLATFDIFENLSDAAEAAATTNTDKNGKLQANNSDYVENFKNDIYYEIININNAQVNDDYAKLKDNSNEKIDLDLRKKTLAEMKELLDKQLNKLKGVIEYIVSSRKEEYTTEIQEIRKTFKDYSKEGSITSDNMVEKTLVVVSNIVKKIELEYIEFSSSR